MDVSKFSLFGQILNIKDAFAREKLLKVSTDDKPTPLYRLMELKYDGTDDITEALNNADSSIYIPEGVFLISKPVFYCQTALISPLCFSSRSRPALLSDYPPHGRTRTGALHILHKQQSRSRYS